MRSSGGKGAPLRTGACSVDVGSVKSLRSSVGENVALVKGSWVAGATKGCGVERLEVVGASRGIGEGASRGIGEGMGVGGGARAKAVEGSALRAGLDVSAHGAGVEGAVDGAGVDVGAGVGVSVVEGDGVDIGAGVGLDVGETRDDGSALGAADEGVGVGLRLGSAVGCFVGAGGGYGFGWEVGALESCSKGHSVGLEPGTRVGADDSEVLYDGATVGKAGVFSAIGIFVGANVRPSLSKVPEMLDGESLDDGSGLDGKLVVASEGLPVDGALVGK